MRPFNPPEGWTAICDNLGMAVAEGLDPDSSEYFLVAQKCIEVHGPIQIYLYPDIVLCVVWDLVAGVWRGIACSRFKYKDLEG